MGHVLKAALKTPSRYIQERGKTIYSRLISYREITKKLDPSGKIAVVSCNTCARECGVGGLLKADQLAGTLIKDGYAVKEELVLQYACSEPVYRKARIRLEADTVLVLACSAGYSCIKRLHPKKKVLKVTEDVGLFVTDTELEAFKVAIPYLSSEEVGREYEMYSGAPLPKRKIRLVD